MKEIRLFLAVLNQKGIRLYLDQGKLKSQSPEGGINEKDRAYIKENKQQIIQYLETLSKRHISGKKSLMVKLGRDLAELSFAQQRLWFIDSLQGGSAEYNMPMAFEVGGHLDIALVRNVFHTILERHEVLRTVFVEEEEAALQRIRSLSDITFDINIEDLSHLAGELLNEQVKALVEADITKPFDLAEDLMLRISYVKKAADSGVLIFNMHHIASDGWSMEVLIKEFFILYHAYSQGQADPLPELKFQYADYAHWQREYLEGEVLESQLEYWEKQLDTLPALHSLPLDYARPGIKQHKGAFVTGELPATTAKQLLGVAKAHKLTPFMLLHGALSLLLSRHSNSTDIVIGTPVANRLQAELEPLIGFFVNTLVMRVDTKHDTLSDYFDHIRQMHLDAQSNQDVPFEQLVERLKTPRSTAHSPLFQIMLTTNTDYGLKGGAGTASFSLPDMDIQPYQSDLIQAKFDLNIDLSISEQGVGLRWNYDTGLFAGQHIAQLNEHLCHLLEGLSQMEGQSAQAPHALPLMSADEIQHLVHDVNTTALDYRKDKCIHELVEQQVRANPDHVALVFADRQLTYKQLNEKANRLAHYLTEQYDIQADTLVGLCVERSLEMMIGVLAILKTGGCYVPFDLEHGADIINARLNSHKVTVAVFSDQTQALLAHEAALPCNINTFFDRVASQYSTEDLGLPCSPESLAYAMSSSGTTGKPKLIGLPHRALNNLIAGITTDNPALSGPHKVLQFASIGFDMSFTDFALALLQGGSLHLITEEVRYDIQALQKLISAQELSLLNLPSSLLKVLSEVGVESQLSFPSVKAIISTAEKLDITDKLKAFFSLNDHIKLINHFGPTETHVCTTFNLDDEVTRWPQDVPIGKPIGNTRCYVLDSSQTLVPKGAAGELYVGGDCLAFGYVGNTALTDEKFVQVDLPGVGRSRLYKTGDLVRWHEDDLIYLGRADDQIKINGYRVELADVEQQIKAHPEIDNATVIYQTEAGQLIAFYTSDSLDEVALQAYLLANMPAYMLPKYLVRVDEFKLTVNGKIDKRSLPPLSELQLQGEYVAPESETEQVLVDIWAALLNIAPESVSITANFFELGGHSLLCIRLVSEIRKRCEVEISVQNVFNHATLQAMATIIGQGTQAVMRPPLLAVKRETDKVAVSFAQQRLWFIDSLQGGSPEYNMPMAFEVSGRLDIALVRDVFTTIVKRHEVLRTVYLEQDGQTLQHIRSLSDIAFDIKVEDLTHLTGEVLNEQVKTLIEAGITAPFNLAEDLMLRVSYVKKTADSGTLIFNMHHIASDGWSMEVLIKEFFALYEAYRKGLDNPLAELEVQYADYAHWQHDYLEGDVLASQLGYWQAQLAELPAMHSLPLDFARPGIKQHKGALVTGELPAAVAKPLLALAKQHQLTPFMLLHGALSLLLSRHSNSSDIVIGTPVANRLQAELEPLIGFFVNTLVLRADTRQDTLSDYFAHIRQVHLDAQSNQDVPFEQLVERLKAPRSTAHTPLFQIMMTTNTDYGLNDVADMASFTLPDVDIQPYRSAFIQAKFDLNVDLSIGEQGIGLRWNYDVSLFTGQHIEQLNDHLCRLLEGLSQMQGQVESALHALPLLSADEIQHQVHELNSAALEYPKDKGLHELFEQQAEENPDNIAVVFADKQLSYRALNEKANQLARYLKAQHHITPDTLVGLCVERSVEMLIGMLAIVKAGGAYVPLDPSYPQERLSYMLEDASLEVVLSQTHVQQVLAGFNGSILALDSLGESDSLFCDEYNKGNLSVAETGLTSSNLAYVIYTSGSTGLPKGVLTEHLSVIRLVINPDFMCLDTDTVMLQSANIAFDAATLEIWGPLLSGGQCILYPHRHVSPEALNRVIEDHRVNALWLTAGLFREWSYAVPESSSLNYLLAGGDVLDADAIKRVQQALPELTLINGYGPTENTTFSTTYTFEQPHALNLVPIGKRLSTDQAYVLDSACELVPYGSVGELCVGGDGLARGYLNRPELTAERFIENPFYDENKPGGSPRLYRTGDLVRYLPDGNLEFIGRADDQVKIRGFRIEPGEVETQLAQLESVDSALVTAKEVAGSQQLVGYVKPEQAVAQSDIADYVASLRNRLSEQLPEYMVPGIIMPVEAWPLTANGKVDRKALPAPNSSALLGEYVAPETETEQLLVDIWAALLNLAPESVSTTANFFELGGHSLLCIRLVSEIRARCEVEVSVQNVFDHSTLQALAGLIDKGTQTALRPELSVLERDTDKVSVSFAQQRLWFIDNLQGGSPEYNLPMAFEVEGPFDIALVKQVFTTIIERHEVLRTVYLEQGGETLQHIRDMSEVAFDIEVEDLTHLAGEALEAQVNRFIETDAIRPFDLASDLMLRVSYVKKAAGSGVLIFNMHHIASDGWSMAVLFKEFFHLSEAYSRGQANPLAPLDIQYADYAHWQRKYLQGEVLESQLDYWQKQLDELPVVHSLPLDYTRPGVKQHKGAVVTGELPVTIAKPLLALAKQYQLTPFMLLHGALSLMLSRHSNSTDIVIGTPVANRLQAELEPLIGFFANTLVLRADTSQDTLSDYFAEIRQVHLDAQSNQDVPFEQLVERLKVPRTRAYNPLCQIVMTTNTDYGLNDSTEATSLTLPGAETRAYQSDLTPAKFDLEVNLSISEQGVGLHWIYDVSLFSAQHIGQLNDHLCRLLEGLSQMQGQVESALHALPLLSADEIQHQVHELNSGALEYPKDKGLHELFEQQAEESPDNIAVVFADKQLSYRALNEKANQLARYLKAQHHITPDTLVGLCVERSVEMLIGMLAIVKAGGAYVPLDPSYPQERLSYMLEDASLEVVLSQTHVQQVLAGFNGSILALDSLGESDSLFCDEYNKGNLSVAETGLTSSNLAYVIYTSGSTGLPKGVLTEHLSVIRLVINPDFMCLDTDTVMLQSANIAFDAATLEIWGPLLSGGQCILYPHRHVSPEALNRVIEDHRVNALWLTAGLFREWSYAVPESSSLNYLLAGGDVLDADAIKRVQQALPELTLINGYGPTENTTFSTTYTFEQPHALNLVPIGKRLSTDQAYVLDSACELVPYGSVGELCVGGDGLARGYLNRPELTAERFIENPFYDENKPGGSPRLYRTGDLVRYLPDGNLEFIGRADDQVKIRGFRIEPGEVETQLAQLESVDSALVTAKEVAGSQQLVGYVKPEQAVAQSDIADYVASLRNRLSEQLPEYMVPGIIMPVEAWPLTANGKVDRKALPAPNSSALLGEYVAPETETEQLLVDIWAALLNLAPESVSTTANFFELGGHSLLCIRLVSEIRARCEVEVSVQNVFDHSTLQALAGLIDKGTQTALRPELSVLERDTDKVSVSFAQQRLWFIDNLQGGSPEYNLPMAFEVEGPFDIALVKQVFTTIIERHEVLRTVYLEQGGETLQHIRDMSEVAFDIEVEDLTHLAGEALEAQVNRFIETDAIRPFDLASDLMLRVSYVKKAAGSGVLIFNMHHIASDGWSMAVLFKEFFHLSEAYSRGQANPLAPLDIQYADYAHWQRKYLQGEVLESQLDYWQKQLDELPVVHSLPLDYTRPATKQHQGATVKGELPATIAQKLLNLAKAHKLTPFMLLHGALSLLLSRHSNSSDIVIGTPVANRLQAELEPLIGFFVNMLVLRADTSQETLSEYFAHIRQVHLDAQSNQDVPFEQLIERLKTPRSTAHNPLFQIMMTTDTDYGLNDDADAASFTLPGAQIRAYQADHIQVKFDIEIDLNINEQGVALDWAYDAGLFSAQHIEQLNAHLCRLLEGLSQMQGQAEQALHVLPLLSPDEIRRQVYDLNSTAMDYPKDKAIHELFEQQAAAHPDHVAVVFEDKQLTYQALNEKANQLARCLKAQHNITPDTLVGLCVERSLEMAIGILAILKAGGAYVPLDPSYPQERLSYMLEDASLEVVLSQTQVQKVLAGFNGSILALEGMAESDSHFCSEYAITNLSVAETGLTSSNLAYVIYTSGSTGLPKGVLVEHRSVVNLVVAQRHNYGLGSCEVGMLLASYAFDAAIEQFFVMLTTANTLVIPTKEAILDVKQLTRLIEQYQVSHLDSTPSHLVSIYDALQLPSVKRVISGGESLLPALCELNKVRLFNVYGPTESCVTSIVGLANHAELNSIGSPIANTQCFILDKQLSPVPAGSVGELYIGGDGLARGYLNRPELTVERFIDNPFYDESKTDSSPRLYRTGDLVRYLPDGNLEFLGRADDQVKIRGFRIELGEVESQLMQLESVDSALVMAQDLATSQQLVAYVKPEDVVAEAELADYVGNVKATLAQTLPGYMIPGIIMVIEEWPLTPSGKVDRKALPAPDSSALQGDYVAPETETEIKVVAILSGLLNVDELSVVASLSDVGVHSLLLIKVCREINAQFNINLTMKELYENNSVKDIALQIDKLISFVVEADLPEEQYEDFSL